MNSTFRRNRGISEACDACHRLQAKIESLAVEAEILRRIRAADCTSEMLASLRRRELTSGRANTADLSRRLQEIDKELEAIRSAFALYEPPALDDDEAEILRVAHGTHSSLEVLDAAGLAVRQHAVKERAGACDLSPAEIAALGDFADPMTPIAAIVLATGLATSAPHSGVVTFRGAVVKGAAGGITGVDVPANQRRTTTTIGVSIRIVGGCDTHSTRGRTVTQCDSRTVPPRVTIEKGGPDVVVTTVYF